jgi:hypothetical protein
MDDIRSRYRVSRRDYSLGAPAAHKQTLTVTEPRPPIRRPLVPTPHRSPALAHTQQTQPAPAPSHHNPAPEPASIPMPHQQMPRMQHHRPRKRRLLKLLMLLVFLATLSGGGWYAHQKYLVKNPFPADIRQNASVDLLYPTKLPAGYTMDLTSIQQTNGILLYDAASGSQRLVFTLQKTPPTFDFATFYKQQFKNNQQFSTKYGQVAVGQNGARYLGSLVDGNTWLLLSASSSHLGAADFSLVLNNLKKY